VSAARHDLRAEMADMKKQLLAAVKEGDEETRRFRRVLHAPEPRRSGKAAARVGKAPSGASRIAP